MKKRWMKSIIEASKIEATPLPFQRGQRSVLRRSGLAMQLRRTA